VTERRGRGHRTPVRYRERVPAGGRAPRGGHPLVEVLIAAGPDRVVAGHADGAPVARDYWQCLTDQGTLVLLYRESTVQVATGQVAAGHAVRRPGGSGRGARRGRRAQARRARAGRRPPRPTPAPGTCTAGGTDVPAPVRLTDARRPPRRPARR
jgi:hypothetical protein